MILHGASVLLLALVAEVAPARAARSVWSLKNGDTPSLANQQRHFQPASSGSSSSSSSNGIVSLDTDASTLYPAHTLAVPIDHFHNSSLYAPHSSGTFALRYWFDASHYAAGGPVIVLQGGETSGADRLVYLQKGILAQLAQATHGIGVVLEHRYYGASFPVRNLTAESLRFLTTEQALADQAFFAQNVHFPGVQADVRAPRAAWIGYGGSYAGAFTAFIRVVYPDVFWGAISSSGVVEAVYDYWQYWEPIREYGQATCINNMEKIVDIADNILLGSDNSTILQLKTAFGLQNLTYNTDFMNLFTYGVSGWQSRNWDPEVNSPSFDQFCGQMNSTTILYPSTTSLTSTVNSLIREGGYGSSSQNLTVPMLNLIGYLNNTEVYPCQGSGSTQDECFSSYDADFYQNDGITATWRSWPWQYCSQWGFLQTGSGAPATELPLVSRLLDLDYESIICREAFNITTPPDTAAINKYGGYNISYPRLAMIDGQQDPWRPATAHASPFVPGVANRTSTADQPFVLIDAAVHHWDENGLFPNETTPDLPPPPVADTQSQEADFVRAWMQEWEDYQGGRSVRTQ